VLAEVGEQQPLPKYAWTYLPATSGTKVSICRKKDNRNLEHLWKATADGTGQREKQIYS
jgi:hypothetical protein